MADNVTNVLQGVITSGTGTAAQLGRPAAGKTGTTSNYTNAWFVGYTPTLSTAVWMGNEQSDTASLGSVTGHLLDGEELTYNQVYGGTWPALTWQELMSRGVGQRAGRPVRRSDPDRHPRRGCGPPPGTSAHHHHYCADRTWTAGRRQHRAGGRSLRVPALERGGPCADHGGPYHYHHHETETPSTTSTSTTPTSTAPTSTVSSAPNGPSG